ASIVRREGEGGAGGTMPPGGLQGACDRGAAPYGFPQLIDVANVRHPKIIAKLMLQVNDPANCRRLVPQNFRDYCGGGPCPGTNLLPVAGSIDYSQERCVAAHPTQATAR